MDLGGQINIAEIHDSVEATPSIICTTLRLGTSTQTTSDECLSAGMGNRLRNSAKGSAVGSARITLQSLPDANSQAEHGPLQAVVYVTLN